MTYRYRNVAGSLNALLVLEAAVRHGSFTKAGEELSLTQPTVSRHISTLESRLRQPLFIRTGNRVEATVNGKQLAESVALSLSHTETAWDSVSRTAQQDEVTLTCSFGFAENWLMPNYGQLSDALPDVRLRVATSDRMESANMKQIDIAIVWDLQQAPDRPHFPLFQEEAFPVCSPAYLAQNPHIKSDPAVLLEANLLHFDVGSSGFMTWRHWFARHGLEYRKPQTAFTSDALPFVTQAALDGRGVALGWRYMIDRLLNENRLVCVGPSISSLKAGYYLLYRDSGTNALAIESVVTWFRQKFRS